MGAAAFNRPLTSTPCCFKSARNSSRARNVRFEPRKTKMFAKLICLVIHANLFGNSFVLGTVLTPKKNPEPPQRARNFKNNITSK